MDMSETATTNKNYNANGAYIGPTESVREFDRIAKPFHKGNHGMSTGATQRPSSTAHLANKSTGKTACGLNITSRWGRSIIVPIDGVTPEQNVLGRLSCSKCRKVVEG